MHHHIAAAVLRGHFVIDDRTVSEPRLPSSPRRVRVPRPGTASADPAPKRHR